MEAFRFLYFINFFMRYNKSMIEVIIGGIVVAIVGHTGVFIYRWGSMNKEVDGIKKDVDKIADMEKEMSALKEFKTDAQKFIDSKLYSDKSPLSLTEFGKKLVQESGLDKILEDDDVMKQVIEEVKKMEPQTKYDVQEMARSVMDNLTNYKPFMHIKEYAFENGKDFQQILRAGAILVRDYYIKNVMELQVYEK